MGPLAGAALYDGAVDSMLRPFVVTGVLLLALPLGLTAALICSPRLQSIMTIAGAGARPVGTVCELLTIPSFLGLCVLQWMIAAPLGWWESTAASAWAVPPVSMPTWAIGGYLSLGGLATAIAAVVQGQVLKSLASRVPLALQLGLALVLMGAGFFVVSQLMAQEAQGCGFLLTGVGYGIGVVSVPVALTNIAASSEPTQHADDDGSKAEGQTTAAAPASTDAARIVTTTVPPPAAVTREQRKRDLAETISTVLVINFPLGLTIGSLGYAALPLSFFDTSLVVACVQFGLLVPLALLAACKRM